MGNIKIKDIAELRDFGRNLQQLGEQMYNMMIQAQHRLNYENEFNWHDDNSELFQSHFEESVKQVKKMSEEFSDYNSYVQKICDIADEYNANRPNM